MGGLNTNGFSLPWNSNSLMRGYTPPPNNGPAPSYGGLGTYNQMAWNSSPLSRPNPYGQQRFQPRGAWYGGSYGGFGGYNGGPLTPTPNPSPYAPPSQFNGPSGYIPKKGGGFNQNFAAPPMYTATSPAFSPRHGIRGFNSPMVSFR